MNSLMGKLISPMGLVVFICFFLPWITISCGNMAMVTDVTAMEIANGITVGNQTQEGNPALYLLLVGAAVIFFAGIKLWSSRNSPAAVGALLGALLVLAIWFLFRKSVQDAINETATQGIVLTREWEMGFWGTFVGGVVGGIGALFGFGQTES